MEEPMRLALWAALLALTGCEPMTPSGDPFAPVRPAPTASPAPHAPAPKGVEVEAAPVEPGGYDFEADSRDADDERSPGDLDAAALARGLGLGDVDLAAPAPKPAEPAMAPVAPIYVPWAGPPRHDWGVRIVSTTSDAQPPRAILGLADGTEHVVQPGTMLPEANLVIMAIGRDAVQIAEIVPEGDHVRVVSKTLDAMVRSDATTP